MPEQAHAHGTPWLKSLRGHRKGTRAVVGILLALVCLAIFGSQVDVQAFSSVLSLERVWYVGAAGVLFVLECVGRAYRWQWLLKPLGKTRVGPLLRFTFIGFASNNLLLARTGELVKPALAARHFGLPFLPALAVGVLERFFDVIGLLGVFVLMTLTLPEHLPVGSSPLLLSMLSRLGPLFSLLGVGGVGLLWLFTLRKELGEKLVAVVVARLPERFQETGRRLLLELLEGLRTLRDLRTLLVVMGISGVVWFNGVISIWLLFQSFAIDLPFSAACFLSVTVAVAVVPPQAPGFVGVWQVAVWQALLAWGIPTSQATAFAIVFWVVSFVPVGAVGMLLLWREGIRLTELLLFRDPSGPGVSESNTPPSAPSA